MKIGRAQERDLTFQDSSGTRQAGNNEQKAVRRDTQRDRGAAGDCPGRARRELLVDQHIAALGGWGSRVDRGAADSDSAGSAGLGCTTDRAAVPKATRARREYL